MPATVVKPSEASDVMPSTGLPPLRTQLSQSAACVRSPAPTACDVSVTVAFDGNVIIFGRPDGPRLEPAPGGGGGRHAKFQHGGPERRRAPAIF